MNNIYNSYNLIKVLLCAAIVSVVINNCAPPPKKRIIYLADQNNKPINLVVQKSKILKNNNISIKVRKVVDERANQDNIGILANSEIIIDDVSKWVNNYFAVLENNPKILHEHAIFLDVYIKKLYLQNISDSKAATVVLQVNYLQNNNLALSKIYRKQLTEVQWNTDDSGIAALLNVLFKNLINEIISDLNWLLA